MALEREKQEQAGQKPNPLPDPDPVGNVCKKGIDDDYPLDFDDED